MYRNVHTKISFFNVSEKINFVKESCPDHGTALPLPVLKDSNTLKPFQLCILKRNALNEVSSSRVIIKVINQRHDRKKVQLHKSKYLNYVLSSAVKENATAKLHLRSHAQKPHKSNDASYTDAANPIR